MLAEGLSKSLCPSTASQVSITARLPFVGKSPCLDHSSHGTYCGGIMHHTHRQYLTNGRVWAISLVCSCMLYMIPVDVIPRVSAGRLEYRYLNRSKLASTRRCNNQPCCLQWAAITLVLVGTADYVGAVAWLALERLAATLVGGVLGYVGACMYQTLLPTC